MTDLADVAAALADRTRARMLEELLGGPPLPAGALAVRVGVAPSTVSGHLRKLERAGLITIASQRPQARGPRSPDRTSPRRSRRSRTSPATRPRPIGLSAVNRRQALREARSCYDHLAGRAGVALADQLVDHGALDAPRRRVRARRRAPTSSTASASTPRRSHPPPAGARLQSTGPSAARMSRARSAQALLDALLARRRSKRRPDGRALNVTRDFLSDDRRSAAA